MADDDLAADEFDTWYTPRDVCALAAKVIGDDGYAIDAIVSRLKGDQIKAAAKSSSWEVDDRMAPPTSIALIRPEFWNSLTVAARKRELWHTNQTSFRFDRDVNNFLALGFATQNPYDVSPTRVIIHYFGIRFRRAEVDSWIADLTGGARPTVLVVIPSDSQPNAATQSVQDTEKTSKGPRVSGDLLKRWHELYQHAYRDTPQDTLANARKSAVGMFPAHSVGRDRVDELCKGRKTGRKPIGKPQ